MRPPFLHPPKKTFLSSSVWRRGEYTWTFNWKESLEIREDSKRKIQISLSTHKDCYEGTWLHVELLYTLSLQRSLNIIQKSFIKNNVVGTCQFNYFKNRPFLISYLNTFKLSARHIIPNFWTELPKCRF